MTRVYLDGNATAPLRPEAREAMRGALDLPAANPSSAHGSGREWRTRIEAARRSVAALIGARPHEIVFTGSGTEAANLALVGSLGALARAAGAAGAGPPRLAALSIEHAAVREPLERWSARGVPVDWIPVGPSGRVDPAELAARLHPGTGLLAAMWANNETGVVQPVEEIAALCAARGIRLFVDAVQAAGRLSIDVSRLSIDLMALSAHKLGGPAGAGALYVREGTALDPLVVGGGQEWGLRGGTENGVALVGFGAAAEVARVQGPAESARLGPLRDRLIAGVVSRVPGARLAGENSERLSNTAQFLVPHEDEEMLILALDRKGYAVSAGSACAAGAHRRSHVLAAMGLLAPGLASVRVSLVPDSRAEAIDGFVTALAELVAAAQGVAS